MVPYSHFLRCINISLEDEKIIKLLKGFLKRLKGKTSTRNTVQPVIIPRALHSISRQAISHHALKVLYRLHEAGYQAYLVGGCVRDLLLGRHPKDFDIATNARPEEVRKLFKNCRLIGKRFRLAHILFGKEIIEVATFRTHHEKAQEHQAKTHQGMIVRDNVYGTLEDDVWRRDFSINALYYNIADFSVVDYTNGMQDIKTKTLRMIGEPKQRFLEDPVRLLRAIRFAGKLGACLSEETENSLKQASHLLQHVSPARLFQEVLKIFQDGATAATFHLLEKYHLLEQLFPQTVHYLGQKETRHLLEEAFLNTDQRIRDNKSISPAFLLAVLLWRPIAHYTTEHDSEKLSSYTLIEKAIKTVLKKQTERLAIPRVLLMSIREICLLQLHLAGCHGSKPYRVLEHPRFRAGYDLLLLRAKAGEPVEKIAAWWTAFYTADATQREKLIKNSVAARAKKPRRRRRKSVKNKIIPNKDHSTL